jgi:hypothetical protein
MVGRLALKKVKIERGRLAKIKCFEGDENRYLKFKKR